MKKTIKVLLKMAKILVIGGIFYGAYKQYDDLTTKLDLAEDLIIGQDVYITCIRQDIRTGVLNYKSDDYGVGERLYNEGVKPFLDRWNNRTM